MLAREHERGAPAAVDRVDVLRLRLEELVGAVAVARLRGEREGEQLAPHRGDGTGGAVEQAGVHDPRAALAAGVVQRGAPVGRLGVEKRGGRGLAVQVGMVGAVRLPPELGGADLVRVRVRVTVTVTVRVRI